MIKVIVITMIIWMIYRMRNYIRFEDPIKFSSPTFQISELVRMVVNKYKKHMSNIVSDFFVLKFFNI